MTTVTIEFPIDEFLLVGAALKSLSERERNPDDEACKACKRAVERVDVLMHDGLTNSEEFRKDFFEAFKIMASDAPPTDDIPS